MMSEVTHLAPSSGPRRRFCGRSNAHSVRSASTRCSLRRRLRGGAAALGVLALFAAVLAPTATAQTRIIGTVVIANGWSSADSAVASALAALESDSRTDAVVLYASSSELPSATANFIRDRRPSEVILIGGTAALSAAVQDEAVALVGDAAVRRIEGTDRFDTAARAVPSTATTFIVANGYSAADTGVAAALAATRSDAAVLLANADDLTGPTERIISEQQPAAVEFVGGTAVLAASLAERVQELAPSVSSVPRHSGESRTATAAAAAPNRSTTLVIANGWSPADMGVAAAYAAITGGAAVLYSQTSALTTPTESRIRTLAPRDVVLVGGNAALSPGLHALIHQLAPSARLRRISGADRIDTAARAAAGTLTPVSTESPNAPTGIEATSRNLSIGLSWRPPRTAANVVDTSVIGYEVQHRACTATPRNCLTSPTWGAWTTHPHSGSGTTATITGLLNDTAYEMRVRARNSFGLSAWSTSARAAPSAQSLKPSAPGSVRVEAADQRLNVSWRASAPNGTTIRGYLVQYRACTAATITCTAHPTWGAWLSHSHSGTGTATSIVGLDNGRAYQVRVRAESNRSPSDWSATLAATPSRLPQFATAPVLAPGDRRILVRWNVPLEHGSGITDYDLQRRACTATPTDCSDPDTEAWGSWQSFGVSGTGTSATITGLTNGVAYEVQVRATSAAGTGPWSLAEKEVPVSAPARVTGVVVEADDMSLVVTWAVPSSNGRPITGYNVQHCLTTADCSVNGTGWVDADPSGAVTRHPIPSLVNATSYRVRVRAINDRGAGPWSSSVTGTPKAVPAAPEAPTLTAGNRKIDLDWAAPDGRGADITAYGIQYRPCSATPRDCSETVRWSGWRSRSHSGTGLVASITGLTNATKHEVRVRARSANGWGPWSAAADEIPFTVPARPAMPTVAPANNQLVMEWRPPVANGRDITGYHVQQCASRLNCAQDVNWSPPSPTLLTPTADEGTGKITHTLEDLVNGTTYRVRVRAVNDAGEGPWSTLASGTPATLPAAPAAPTLAPANGQISVQWQMPANNGSSITGYHVEYRRCTADPLDCSASPEWSRWFRHTHSGTGVQTIIRGLTNGTKYQVQVRANTANGAGPWSDGAGAEATPQTVPSRPTGVTVHPDHESLSVAWTASAANGSTITGYALQYRECTATRLDCSSGARWGDWTSGVPAGADAESATISSLVNGTRYQVQVRATTSGGGSPWSQTASGIPAAVPEGPAAPTLNGQDQQLVVTWAAPDDRGEAITGYGLRYRRCSSATPDCSDAATVAWGNWQSWTHGGTGITAIISNLIDGTAYQVQVRARNDNGWGPWSPSPTTPGVPSGAPARPTPPRVTVGDGQLEVDWIAPQPNGSVITGYTVQYRACTAEATPFMVRSCASNPTWGALETATVTGAEATADTLTGLTNGTAYQVQVRAVAGDRPGPWSTPVVAMPAGTPAAPATVDLASGNRLLYVRWSTPDSMGATVTGFKVEWCDATQAGSPCTDGANWETRTLSASTRAYTISGLANEAAHEVRVITSSRAHGLSDPSAVESEEPGGPNAPAAPRLSAASQAITVSWTAANVSGRSAVTAYEVAHCTDVDGDNSVADDCTDSLDLPDANWTEEPHSTLGDLSLQLTSLTNGNAYRVRVRAQNNEGWSRWSSWATATPRP